MFFIVREAGILVIDPVVMFFILTAREDLQFYLIHKPNHPNEWHPLDLSTIPAHAFHTMRAVIGPSIQASGVGSS